MNRKLKLHLCLYYITVIFIALCVSCVVNKKDKDSNIRVLEMYSIFPMAVHQENIFYDTSIITLTTSDSFVLYEIPVRRNNSVVLRDKDGNAIGDTLITLPSSPRYFFYHKGDLKGTFYDTARNQPVWTYAVDSFLRERSVTNFENNLNLMIETDSLVASITDTDNKLIVDKYVTTAKDENGYDSLLITFSSKMKSADYSFSKRQDSIRNSKITSVELKFNASPAATRPELKVSRRVVLLVKEGRNENPASLTALIRVMDSLRLKTIASAK
ncbi:MAG: hypothetical protein DI535_21010 [Citrobacter freundii]|nr:MAG: hypothetical protein DI535_21010 [Citrobacter freundii]